MVGHGEGLGDSLGLVVAAAGADRVDVAPVVLALGVNIGVAVNFRGAGQEEPGVLGSGQAERVVGAERADLQRGDRVGEVVGGAGRAGEVENVVDCAVDGDRLGDIVLDELEAGIRGEVVDVLERAGQEVIHANDFVPFGQEPFAKVGTHKAGSAGDDRSRHFNPSPTETSSGKEDDRPGTGPRVGLSRASRLNRWAPPTQRRIG